MLKNYRKKVHKAVNFLLFLVPFVLFLLPKDFFNEGQTICLSKSLAGIECYACGLTRGVMHLIHFDWEGAWHFNKLSFIVLPLLFILWLKATFAVFFPEKRFLKRL